MHWFKSYLVNPENGLVDISGDNRTNVNNITSNLLQQIQENTVGIGETGFFQIDYSFISQVRLSIKLTFLCIKKFWSSIIKNVFPSFSNITVRHVRSCL